jgi:hypothetical protein
MPDLEQLKSELEAATRKFFRDLAYTAPELMEEKLEAHIKWQSDIVERWMNG